MTDTKLQQAAALIAAAELSALTLIQTATKDFIAAIDAAVANIDYPASAGFSSEAQRIANNLKMGVQWPAQEIEQKLNPTPVTPVVTPVAPTA